MTRLSGVLVPITVVFVTAASVVGLWAYLQLDAVGRVAFYGDVARLSYQAIVIIVLGALVKSAIDDARERRSAQEQETAEKQRTADLRIRRRSDFIGRLVDASHVVDVARTQIWANRSVRTWTAQMDELIAAYVDLRDLRHDVTTSQEAEDPIFNDWGRIQEPFGRMERYLSGLVNEYAEHKKALSEFQSPAETAREPRQNEWQELLALRGLGDFIDGGPQYSSYRDSYVTALAEMRRQLPEHARTPRS